MEKIIDIEDRIPTLREKRRKRTNIKFIVLTTVFVFILFLLLYFQSPYSNIKKIEVNGSVIESELFYLKQSGLKQDDSMWGFRKNEVEAALMENNWVKSATVERKLLTKVIIQIEEWQKVAYISKDNHFYPMLENGVILEEQSELLPLDAPIFLSFEDEDLRKRLLKELVKLDKEVLALISQINATPTSTDPFAITLFMNDGYEVRAEITTLASKLNYYPSIIAQIESTEGYEKGIIDIEVGSYYRSYSDEYASMKFDGAGEGQEVGQDEEGSAQ
ncbi:FtsQ-type POTRA domain-containing protein [Solibacillus sp. CAU 1738]|uniref:cell division protein FtsQ/DivIB n=1 Tax=Solibacillus sp. CAU 1738 TaxID=3140363 RepID=UPI0032602E51